MNTIPDIDISDIDAIKMIEDKSWYITSSNFIWCKIATSCADCHIGGRMTNKLCTIYRGGVISHWIKENKYPWLFI